MYTFCKLFSTQKVKVMLERAEEVKKKLNDMYMAEYEEVIITSSYIILHHVMLCDVTEKEGRTSTEEGRGKEET